MSFTGEKVSERRRELGGDIVYEGHGDGAAPHMAGPAMQREAMGDGGEVGDSDEGQPHGIGGVTVTRVGGADLAGPLIR